jgi:outer membrane receptor for ferrienterochelin and colicin
MLMQNPINFKRKIMATAVASVMAAGFSSVAMAQDNALEEVIVTGIKASLQASMDVKREAVGVVDAISAEDIGKMPDTNLAESLQRIPGVSIDRVNGEGSKVTVRGLSGDYNLVTLNSRQMHHHSVPAVLLTSRTWPLKVFPGFRCIKAAVLMCNLAVWVH